MYRSGYHLKPCPFCGGQPVWFEAIRQVDFGPDPNCVYGIMCMTKGCIANSDANFYTTRDAAGVAWNRRYNDSTLTIDEIHEQI